MAGEHGTNGEMKNAYKILFRKVEEKRLFTDLSINVRVLKWNLNTHNFHMKNTLLYKISLPFIVTVLALSDSMKQSPEEANRQISSHL
jgi:hypothetical protein